MAYLNPPPFPAPVIVEKDVGGVVADYQAQTERYRLEGREVRLRECRSACTLALSLPNVCVWPSSLLKFHKAYDEVTKVRDEGVSAQLMAAYPEPVRARLGALTTDYRVLTGAELIDLGVRDCRLGQTQVARRAPPPPSALGGSSPGLWGAMVAALSPATPAPAPTPAAAPRPAPEPEARAAIEEPVAPLPPRRPIELAFLAAPAAEAAPVPPRRPPELSPPPGLPNLIAGAQPTLPYGALSYAAFGR